MKITTIVGARPQFIKAAALTRCLKHEKNIQEIIIHTGQHYDESMSNVFFNELDIPKPDYNLGIGGGSHGQNTGRMIEKIESVLFDIRPDYLLVYGDTDSTLAGGLAAAKLHIPVIHVEAGLRSYNRQMPEEINRVLTDHVADLLLAPTQTAVDNLLREGIDENRIRLVGDIMYDAALFYADQAESRSRITEKLELNHQEYILATIHRQENTDNKIRLSAILQGFTASSLPVILPVHPRTAKKLEQFSLTLPPPVLAIDPVGYLDMVMLEKKAKLIVTDSGGVQKEAFFHKVPCITCRQETEWVELVEAGVNKLVKPEELGKILASHQPDTSINFPENLDLYGDGNSAEKIIDILVQET